MSIWNGIFAPVMVKHRDGCGDISNHIEIKSVNFNENTNMVEVTIGFIDSGENTWVYEYPYRGESSLDLERAMKEVVRQIPGA